MTALFSAPRRAEEFAAAVDAPQQEVRDELQPLVDLVGTLRVHSAQDPGSVPRAEFAAELRTRLMAEAAQVLAPDGLLVLPARTHGRRERRLVAAASAAVLIGGTAGIAAAAQDALPGDALYPVKRGIERVEAGVSISQAGKGRELLHQANGRLVEVDGLLAADTVTAARVPSALRDFTSQAEQGGSLLLDSYQQTGDPATVRTVRQFTADGIGTLQDLARTAPPESQEDLTTAALALRALDRRATNLCATCASDLPALEVPGILLVASEVGRALTAVDPAELDNSHPFLVPKKASPRGDRTGGTGARVDDGTGGNASGVTGGATGGVTGGLPGGATGGTGNQKDDAQAPGGSTSLPDPKDATETAKKKVQDTTEELGETAGGTVGSITDGLGGAVETVLPDPQPGSLLP